MKRWVLPALSLLALCGAATERLVSSRLSRDFIGNQHFCRSYLCDDFRVVMYAYNQQVKGTAASLATATRLLEDVLERGAASPRTWADVGDALAQAGSFEKAKICYERATGLGRGSAGILAGAGAFYLMAGDIPRALSYLSRALTLTPDYDKVIFSYYAAPEIGIDNLLAFGLPAERRPAQAYLRHVMLQGDVAGARKIWPWLAGRRLTDQALAVEYVNFLLNHRAWREAAGAWTSWLGERRDGYGTTQFLYNGDFEQEPAGAGLDWMIEPHDHVRAGRDASPYSGKFALAVRFDGAENTDYGHVSQIAVVPPGRYRFRAFVRSDKVTTDQGPRFQISDAENPGRLNVQTEAALGTAGWRGLEADFVVTQATPAIRVRLVRPASMKFDNQIRGDVWIDQVSLTRLP